MNTVEQNLLTTLLELDHAARSMPAANPKPNLLPLFARIEELSRQLPEGTDPNLLHYLQRRSYEKATLLLQGRQAENARGNCGR